MPKQRKRLPFVTVQIDQDDVPVVERRLGRGPGGYGVNGMNLNHRIYVDPRQCYQGMLESVFSEALHEMWSRTQLTDHYKLPTEEWILHEMLAPLLDFVAHNPEWVHAYLGVMGRETS